MTDTTVLRSLLPADGAVHIDVDTIVALCDRVDDLQAALDGRDIDIALLTRDAARMLRRDNWATEHITGLEKELDATRAKLEAAHDEKYEANIPKLVVVA